MLKRPVRYDLVIPVPRHQSAENGVVMQPLAFLCLKIPKFPPAGFIPLRAIQVLVSGLEEFALQGSDSSIAHRTLLQLGHTVSLRHLLIFLDCNIREPFGIRRKRDRLISNRANDIVWTMVRTGLVHRQDLNDPETFFCCPLGQLD